MENHLPIRILQAFVVNDKGGLTGYICQNYRFIDKSKVQFDFLTFEKDKLDFEDEFTHMGAKFYHISRPSNPISYMESLKRILRQTHYAAIHFNMSYANFIPLIIVRWLGANKIIMHSHSTAIDDSRAFIRLIKTFIHRIGRFLMPYMADEYLACSSLAASWMFSEKIIQSKHYHLVNNAIDVAKFKYNRDVSKVMREKLKIKKNDFVSGHVGRFTYQKNHYFLISIFKKVHEKVNNSRLLLIGDGPEERLIKRKVKLLGLDESVLFLGKRNDVNHLFQAMDCFILPSRFEGLAIVGVEAQAAGLPCIFSNTISKEINVSKKAKFISLDDDEEWVNSTIYIYNNYVRLQSESLIRSSGYDIKDAVFKMESIYEFDL